MADFRIAKPSIFLKAIAKSLVPLYLRVRYGDTELRVTQETLAIFAALQDKPVLICPNHSHNEDGEVVFWLSSATHSKINILTARELFENYRGVGGIVLQRLGCYSVSRGMHDSKAISFTEQLLENSQYKIVLFPEGEISYDSQAINPLESGAAYMALEACQHLLNGGKPADVYIVPLAISYEYIDDISTACADIVAKLEENLALPHLSSLSIRQRAQRIAVSIVARAEANLNINPDDECSFDSRMQTVLEAFVEHYENMLICPLPPLRIVGKIHILQAKILDLKLAGNHKLPLDEIQAELMQAIALHSIKESRFAETASQESFADALAVLEEHLLGTVSQKGSRAVTLSACEPLNVLNHIQDYLHSKSKTVHTLTDIIASRLQRGIRRTHLAECELN